MYLPKTYKPYKKRACVLPIDGVIRVFTLSRPNFHRVQCKFQDPFSAGRLASSPLTTLYVCIQKWSAQAHKFAAPRVLSFSCCKRKNDFLLNIWRLIVHVLLHWPHPGFCRRVYMDTLYKRFKFQLNRMKNSRVIRGQVSDIPYQLWTASLSRMWLSPIGMKLMPGERSGPMSPWGQVPKISCRPFFELWPLKVDIC